MCLTTGDYKINIIEILGFAVSKEQLKPISF